jgi:hypothetical protein
VSRRTFLHVGWGFVVDAVIGNHAVLELQVSGNVVIATNHSLVVFGGHSTSSLTRPRSAEV